MTGNLAIGTGIRLTINDDPARVISFDPGDVGFAERFYDLLRAFEAKQVIYSEMAAQLDDESVTDEHGLPANMANRFAFVRDVCTFMHEQIDAVFGEGTARAVFEGKHNMDAITQFFEGIAPYVERERRGKVEKYRRPTRRMGGNEIAQTTEKAAKEFWEALPDVKDYERYQAWIDAGKPGLDKVDK